jgi:flagellar operon protein
VGPVSGTPSAGKPNAFEAAFKEAELRLSKHAKTRVEERMVDLNPTERALVARAVNQARTQGVQKLAVVTPDSVMLVAPASGTVVTAMGRQEAEKTLRLFTSIDAVVLVGRT